MLKSLIYFLLLILFGSPGFAEGISLSQAVDKTETPFEETVTFELSLSWNGPQSAYHFTRPLQPEVDRMKIQKFSSTISSTGSGPSEVTTKVYRYTLKPTAAGMGQIQPVIISYVTWPDSIPGEIISEPISVIILDPVPIAEEYHLPVNTIVIIIVSVVVVAAVILVIIFIRSKRNRNREPILTPNQQFLEKLAKLKLDTGSDLKRFQTGFYKMLLEYLEKEYNLEVTGLSSEAIVTELNTVNMDSALKEKISGWLLRAEKEKFTPLAPVPGETIRLEAEIRTFFESL